MFKPGDIVRYSSTGKEYRVVSALGEEVAMYRQNTNPLISGDVGRRLVVPAAKCELVRAAVEEEA